MAEDDPDPDQKGTRRMITRRSTCLLAAVASLAFSAAAQAHVTAHPNALPAGGEITISFNVPNEMANAYTTKVDAKFPGGFVSLDPEPVPGWTAKLLIKKLAKPVQTDDGPISFEVDRVIWTATGRGLPPGEALRLPFTVAVPKKASGTVLTFKVLQINSNRKIVRWIGPRNADEPAPQAVVIGADSATADYPGGVTAIKHALKARKLQSTTRASGAATPTPLLAGVSITIPLLAGAGLVRRRRKAA
jgi:uncharacterized protein